jgi:hypothetical protein
MHRAVVFTRSGGSNGLAILLVLHVASSEDPLHASVGGVRLGHHVSRRRVQLELPTEELRRRRVPDGEEEASHLEILDLATHQVLDLDASQQRPATVPVRAAEGPDNHRVPDDLDLGVLEHHVLHDLGSPERAPAVDDVDAGAVLGQEAGLLHGGVAAAHDGERPVAEYRGRAVAHGAGGDAVVPVRVGPGEVEAPGDGSCGHDDGVGEHGRGLVGGDDTEGPGREVDGGDGLGEDAGAEALRLVAAALHEVAAHDARGEAREVLHDGGGGELPARGHAVGHPALEQHGLEVRAGRVHGRRVRGGAAPDDAYARAERPICCGSLHG